MKHFRIHITFLLTLALIACDHSSQSRKKVSRKNEALHFSNVSKVIRLGDTARIEIENFGDTMLIRHYIDLAGSKGSDNFDNSYNAVCMYKRRSVDSIVQIKDKKVKILATLSEEYQTEFSKGTNYYFITEAGDTILNQHILEYIK